eukprot:TRINITY_DN1228_c0_g1_i11.p1 TRINITY_DN1228_c0_g1~~TRINITY_DN1228_c0_g1_i11.p1  ORF type:complete len:270 (+),score=42.52 TRINITY_DN1228_c0_g1_i11:305-1114(+)
MMATPPPRRCRRPLPLPRQLFAASPPPEGIVPPPSSPPAPPPTPIRIDSCGTGGGSPNWFTPGGRSYHEGDPPDARMTAAASARGVALTSRSRPLTAADFDAFDWIVVMDGSNAREVARAAAAWAVDVPSARARVVRMLDFVPGGPAGRAVPDPYYGGGDGFEKVLVLLESAGGGCSRKCRRWQRSGRRRPRLDWDCIGGCGFGGGGGACGQTAGPEEQARRAPRVGHSRMVFPPDGRAAGTARQSHATEWLAVCHLALETDPRGGRRE